MVGAVDRVFLHVLQGVVHPTHVPLVTEAEPSHVGWAADHRPGGGFLGYRHGAGRVFVD